MYINRVRKRRNNMSLEILDKPLMKALLDGTIPFHEVMYAYDIRLHITERKNITA